MPLAYRIHVLQLWHALCFVLSNYFIDKGKLSLQIAIVQIAELERDLSITNLIMFHLS